MITDIIFTIIISLFCFFGFKRPYIALTGAMWVNTVKPQQLSYGFLAGAPLSMIMTMIFVLSLISNSRKIKFPRDKGPLLLMVFLMIWVSITTYFAHYPDLAAFKYDVAIKTMFFSLLIPIVLHKQGEIETVIWGIVISVGFFVMISGAETLFGGGGYAKEVIQGRASSSGITETSTLSSMSMVIVPLILYLYKNSMIIKAKPYLKWYLLPLIFACILSVIGTYARTGLVAGAVLALLLFWYSKYKLRYLAVGCIVLMVSVPFLPERWIERMSTVTNASEESSALGRLVVWRWTIDYASENPFLGGGFYSYIDNKGQLNNYVEGDERFEKNEKPKAYHSIIFELLGEHGYVGLIVYLGIVFSTIVKLFRNSRPEQKDKENCWSRELSKYLVISIFVYLVGGLFVSIAFEPWLFYLVFTSLSLINLSRDSSHDRKVVS